MKNFNKQLKIGNLESNIAICTLWTRVEKILKTLPSDSFFICGNLYTNHGINYLIRTILANPIIRYLVVCGNDLTGSGDSLIKLMEKGIDGNRKIIGADAYIDLNIPLELIEKIRKNVKVIDLRGKEKFLLQEIRNLKRLPPFSKPIHLPEIQAEIEELATEEVGFKLEGNTISGTWLKALDLIMKFGEVKDSEYGIRQKEILNLVAVIKNDEKRIPAWLGVKKSEIERYCNEFVSPRKRSDLAYTYGERLFKYSLAHVPGKLKKEAELTVNQIENVVKKLRAAPFTRRAVAVTWNPGTDIKMEAPPCLTQITWNVKKDKLHQTAIFRSHDIFGAWVLNAFGLRRLQQIVAEKIGKELGTLTLISNSAHIYEDKWSLSERLLEKHHRNKIISIEKDPLGYFLIEVKKGRIRVQHYLNDGRKSKYVFEGKNAQELYRRILNENLVSRFDHAAYLGYELAKAEEALKNGKKFIQDQK